MLYFIRTFSATDNEIICQINIYLHQDSRSVFDNTLYIQSYKRYRSTLTEVWFMDSLPFRTTADCESGEAIFTALFHMILLVPTF